MFLYLKTDGLTITKDGGKIIITNPKDGNQQDCPLSLIEGVVLFGNIQISTQAIRSFLKAKIPVFFVSSRGNYFGKLDTIEYTNVELLYEHINASMNSEISLHYAKVLVYTKLQNCRNMLMRRVRFLGVCLDMSIINELQQIVHNIYDCTSKESLRGLEGYGSKVYFQGFAQCVSQPFVFSGRNRRPPKDPINSMLSLGYTLLAQNIHMILDIQGINAQIGFLHQPKDLKTLLVLDIMEMFRARIVDDLILRLVKNKKIHPDMFYYDHETGACLCNQESLEIFLGAYYATMFKEKDHEIAGKQFLKIRIIERTLEAFKQSLVKKTFDYQGFLIR